MKPLQLSMSYLAEEDRILLLIGTPNSEEYRFLLTRRIVKSLINALVKLMSIKIKETTMGPLNLKSAMLNYQHQQAVANSNFEEKFHAEESSSFPLGKDMILINGFAIKEQGDGFLLALQMVGGKEINMTLPKEVLHSLYKLLADTVVVSEWGIDTILQSVDTKPNDMSKLM